MRAGKLDRQIVLQRVTEAPDGGGYGEPVKTWATLATVWAWLETLTGRESYGAGQERVSWADVRFTIRARADLAITTKDRVSYGGKTYDILAVQENTTEPRNWVTELLCKARGEAAA